MAIEFAIISVPFFLLLLFVFELSYDLFQQEVLDGALHQAARQIEIGNAVNVTNGAAFVSDYLCPATKGLLSCKNLWINVQNISPTSTQDYYDFTTGTLPVSGGALDLSAYASANFCNSGPTELLLISAIYVSPTIVGVLMPHVISVSYAGKQVHATLSQVGVVSETYPVGAVVQGAAPSC